MLLLPVRVRLITRVSFGREGPVAVSGRRSECTSEHHSESYSERHRGAGNLSLMGIRNVCFAVGYDIVLIRVLETAGTDETALSGKVHCLTRRNGRPLPEGVYSLDRLPGCRLAHFGGRWKLHFS